jgi:ubiquinone/menaquinone biosynthesis C-methylase UbiE
MQFDRIFLSFILEIFPDAQIPRVLENCKNLLNEDGQMCVVSIQYEKSIPIRIYEWTNRVIPNVVDCRPIELEQALLKAEFNILAKRREKMWGLPIEIIVVE